MSEHPGDDQPEQHYGCLNCMKPIATTGLCEACGIADTTGHTRAVEAFCEALGWSYVPIEDALDEVRLLRTNPYSRDATSAYVLSLVAKAFAPDCFPAIVPRISARVSRKAGEP